MIFKETILKDSYIIDLNCFNDERGWFARTFCKKEFIQIGHKKEWVQLNHSFTKNKGIIRGMHYQLPPYKEIKLVRCISGEVFDVIIDLRKESPTFLKWYGTILSAKNKMMIYIPEGFAHGFQTLTDDCELIYHHTQYYTPEADSGVRFDDPIFNINWVLPPEMLSEKDRTYKLIDNTFKGINL